MTFKQYLKIETSLGGVNQWEINISKPNQNNKAFIKACLNYILPQARHHHIYRTGRHAFIRDGLEYRQQANKLFLNTKLEG